MNCVNLIGRACAQPSIKYVGIQRTPLAEFTLAVDDPLNKDRDTNKAKTYFFLIQVWNTKAEIAYQHLTKGQRVGITGRIVQENFAPKDNPEKTVTKTRIVAEYFTLLDRPNGHYSANNTSSEPAPADLEDRPF